MLCRLLSSLSIVGTTRHTVCGTLTTQCILGPLLGFPAGKMSGNSLSLIATMLLTENSQNASATCHRKPGQHAAAAISETLQGLCLCSGAWQAKRSGSCRKWLWCSIKKGGAQERKPPLHAEWDESFWFLAVIVHPKMKSRTYFWCWGSEPGVCRFMMDMNEPVPWQSRTNTMVRFPALFSLYCDCITCL